MNTMLLPLVLRFLNETGKKAKYVKKFHIACKKFLHSLLLVFGLLLSGAVYAQVADVGVHQTTPASEVPSDSVLTYRITVTNYGPNAAAGVALYGALPSGVLGMSEYVSVEALPPRVGIVCTTSGAPIDAFNCNVGAMTHEESVVVELKVRLPGIGAWSSEFHVSSTTTDNNDTNDTSKLNVTTVASADLRLEASSNAPDPVATGAPYTYTLTVHNDGPNNLPAGQQPTVRFTVPTGVIVTSRPVGTNWDCQPSAAANYPRRAGEEITCTRTAGNDGLADGASFPPITVNAIADRPGNNTADFEVSSPFPDRDRENNISDVTVNVIGAARSNISITKTRNAATVQVGNNVTYTITPRFEGGAPPQNIVVTDELHANLTYVNHIAADPPWACNFGVTTANTLTCTISGEYTGPAYANLPAITLIASVDAGGVIPNTADLTADNADPATASINVTGENVAQLAISKTPSVTPPVMVGQEYSFTVRVTNGGPRPIPVGEVITVTERIPAGMTVRSDPSNMNWSCNQAYPFTGDGATLITCTHTALAEIPASGAGAVLPDLIFPVVHADPGALTNNACVLAREAPLSPTSLLRCTSRRVPGTALNQEADLSITKAASSLSVYVGEPLTYTLTIHNAGPGTAEAVVVADVLSNLLPANSHGLRGFVSATPDQGTCTPAAPADGSATVSCNLGNMVNGATVEVVVVIHPNNTGTVPIWRGNTASVTSDTFDPALANNTYTISDAVNSGERTEVRPRTDITVTKGATPGPTEVLVGEPLVYTVTVVNPPFSAAEDVVMVDPIPAGAAFWQDINDGGGNCTWPAAGATAGEIRCEWANIPSGAQRAVTYWLRPLNSAQGLVVDGFGVVNTATVSTITEEIGTAAKTASTSRDVIAPDLDVRVEKVASAMNVTLTDLITYTITITNNGTSHGSNLVMRDTFPSPGVSDTALFSYVAGSLNAPGAICVEPNDGDSQGEIVCTFPTIAPGGLNAIVVTYQMRATSVIQVGELSGTHTNFVEVRVDETELTLDNNWGEVRVTATLAPLNLNDVDLEIGKSIDRGTVRVGGQAVYTFTVTNEATSSVDVIEANGVYVRDALPPGVIFVSSNDGCSLAPASPNVVICPVGDLNIGDSKDFSITVRIDGDPSRAGTRHDLNNRAWLYVNANQYAHSDASINVQPLVDPLTTGIPILNFYGLLALLAGVAGIGAVYRRKYRQRSI